MQIFKAKISSLIHVISFSFGLYIFVSLTHIIIKIYQIKTLICDFDLKITSKLFYLKNTLNTFYCLFHFLKSRQQQKKINISSSYQQNLI